jgi:hypothetical protein
MDGVDAGFPNEEFEKPLSRKGDPMEEVGDYQAAPDWAWPSRWRRTVSRV